MRRRPTPAEVRNQNEAARKQRRTLELRHLFDPYAGNVGVRIERAPLVPAETETSSSPTVQCTLISTTGEISDSERKNLERLRNQVSALAETQHGVPQALPTEVMCRQTVEASDPPEKCIDMAAVVLAIYINRIQGA